MEYRRKKDMEDTENYKVEDSWMIGGRRWKNGGVRSLRMEGIRKGDMLHGGGVGECSVFCLPGPTQTESQTLPHHHREAE